MNRRIGGALGYARNLRYSWIGRIANVLGGGKV